MTQCFCTTKASHRDGGTSSVDETKVSVHVVRCRKWRTNACPGCLSATFILQECTRLTERLIVSHGLVLLPTVSHALPLYGDWFSCSYHPNEPTDLVPCQFEPRRAINVRVLLQMPTLYERLIGRHLSHDSMLDRYRGARQYTDSIGSPRSSNYLCLLRTHFGLKSFEHSSANNGSGGFPRLYNLNIVL